MGYSTSFSGELKFASPLVGDQFSLVSSFLGEDCRDHEEWGEQDLTYIDLELTNNKDGLQWDGSEKTYDLTEKVNLLLRVVRRTYPEFGLTGTLIAQGEEVSDRWILTIENGMAVEKPFQTSGTEIKCPHCGEHFVVPV